MATDQTLAHVSAEVRTFLKGPHEIFIDGVFQPTPGTDRLEVFDPATGQVIASVPACGEAEIDQAVRAARAALTGEWSRLRPADRERLILKLADCLEAQGETFAQLESLNNGKNIGLSRAIEVGASVDYLRYMAGWATKIEGHTLQSSIQAPPAGSRYMTYTLREPVGVVGAIIPWNFPLSMLVWKVASALAAGCTIVVKPSEETPLTALLFGRLCQDAGLPSGVVNIVTGRGDVAGAALARNTGVDKLAFTGSTEVGKLIGHAAIDGMKRFTLELGGKSPMLLFPDMGSNQDQLVARLGLFFNQGQVCTAATRVLIDRRIHDEMVERLGKVADSLTFGSGLDPESELNPVVSAKQRDRVSGFIQRAAQAGAHLASGQRTVPEHGFFVAPTLLSHVTPDMEVVRDEVFGPVIVAMPFDDEEEAVALANDTSFGLAASVWTSNLDRAMRVTKALRAGTVWVNTHNVLDANLPFGGMKQSGLGREHGREGLEHYLETKTVMIRYQ
ncbi:aldehyde dehydrogenase family protein [Phyllobacterium sophorae]|uniref:Aldehyde dehydrogenase n=1 Tax=Phyllobacterium sophorae TaxID=1520277 RepID=A0A2P7B6R2_9HYPH|nr:aldehyde dehydrogenase family protein [Phyllobacterium sophorae]PSH62110.1 aldehyde dehydrogenase [Phyllobacterium sophorae]